MQSIVIEEIEGIRHVKCGKCNTIFLKIHNGKIFVENWFCSHYRVEEFNKWSVITLNRLYNMLTRESAYKEENETECYFLLPYNKTDVESSKQKGIS